ncbi:MAG TPA: acyltransferase [Clostridia bacterium]|nr:acyltransferase [Clostridia bacterium]
MATITSNWTQAVAEERTRSATKRFYHPELDILRFFAFFMVFLHHALPHDPAFYTAMNVPIVMARLFAAIGASGAFGVNLFFVLSAYLITELLLRERALLGDVDLRAFYMRRILRIWPLYFAFLAVAAALAIFMPGQQLPWNTALAFTALSGNWWIVFKGFPSSVIFPLWSVSIEEQFYIFWPAAMRRLRQPFLLAFAVLLLGIASLTRLYLGTHGATETQVWCNTFAQLDPIALGILAAIFLRGRAPQLSTLARVALVAFGVVALAAAGSYWQIKGDPLTVSRIMLGYPAVALGSIALLLAFLCESAPLRKSAFVYLGRISYGLYVFHILGLMSSDYIVPHYDSSFARYMLRNAVALSITIALSAASYRWLETPFLNLKQRFTHVLSRPGG